MNKTEEYKRAINGALDVWVAASGGMETPFAWGGTRWLWCYNPAQRKHAYMNLDTDMIEPFPPFLS